MLRWRTVNPRFSSKMIDLRSCPCFLWQHWILRFTCLSTTVASILSLLVCWVFFCASRDSNCCSRIFTKSIAPHTIDVWSPLREVGRWDERAEWVEMNVHFGVCGFVQPQCVSFSGSPSLLCFSLLWFSFSFSSLCSLMSPSCCFCACISNEHCLLGLAEILGLTCLHWFLLKTDSDSSGWFLSGTVNETPEFHMGDCFLECFCLWRTKPKKGLAAFVDMEFLYFARS